MRSDFNSRLAVLLLFASLLTVRAQSNLVPNSEIPGSGSEPQNGRYADITPPRPIYSPNPEYSKQARKAGFQGSCELSLRVGTDGVVRDVKVTKSLGMGLDEKSVNAVRSWRFEPARKSGIPIEAQITVEVSFRLGGNKKDVEEIQSKLPTVSPPPVVMRVEECPTRESSNEKQATGPQVVVADIVFEGAHRISASEQKQIAASIKRGSYGSLGISATDEIVERVRAAWQNRGYFKVNVTADSRELTSNAISRRIAVTVHVDEGNLYHLGGISFKNNLAIRQEILRRLFPIKDGEVFSRDKIAEGLEALRKAYGEYGYINFTSIPNTNFDDENGLVYLQIDVDEDKQFYISDITLLGSDQASLVSAASDLPFKPGEIVNTRLIELFLLKEEAVRHRRIYFPQLDDQRGTVALTYDLRQCPGE